MHDGSVLLIRAHDLKGSSVWTFPKGQLNQQEKSPQAAIREVEEETGWRCRIETELPKTQYWFQRKGVRIKKTVRWFLMSPIEEIGSHDEEVEEVAWVTIQEAMDQLTYKSDRDVLQKAVGGEGKGSCQVTDTSITQ